MTSEKSIPETITVSATVKEKVELEDGYKFTLDIPVFKTKFPTVVYGCSLKEGAGIKPNQAISVKLIRAKLQDDKSGELFWHYSWRWARFGGVPTPHSQGEATASAPENAERRQPHAETASYKDLSIERQCALKAAAEIACARIQAGEKISTYHIGQLANWFAGLLSGTVTVGPIAFKICKEDLADGLFVNSSEQKKDPAAAPGSPLDGQQHASHSQGPAEAPYASPAAPAAKATAPADELTESFLRGLKAAGAFPEIFTPAILNAWQIRWKHAGGDYARKRTLLEQLAAGVAAAREKTASTAPEAPNKDL